MRRCPFKCIVQFLGVLLWAFLSTCLTACSSSPSPPPSRPQRPLFHNVYSVERGYWVRVVPAIDSVGNVVYFDEECNMLLIVIRAGRVLPSSAHTRFDASSTSATLVFNPYQQKEFSVTVERTTDTMIVAWANGELDRHSLATGEAAIVRDGAPYGQLGNVFAFIKQSPKASASLKDFARRIAARLSSDATVQ